LNEGDELLATASECWREAMVPGVSPGTSLQTTLREENTTMNWDQIEGNWKQIKGKVKEKWGKLTDDELDVLAGKKDQLIGKIQERYGIAKSEAAKQVEDFGRTCEIEPSSTSSSRRP
jgi:uncharacterized protein YjbJ (UPF0337 family)